MRVDNPARAERYQLGAHPSGRVNEDILKLLVDTYDSKLVTTSDEDIKRMLA